MNREKRWNLFKFYEKVKSIEDRRRAYCGIYNYNGGINCDRRDCKNKEIQKNDISEKR